MSGFAHTDGGRLVYDTGKVCIGLRAGLDSSAPRRLSARMASEMSADALAIQAALLAKAPAKPKCKPAIKPRCGLPTLTPTTALGRLWAWLKHLTAWMP